MSIADKREPKRREPWNERVVRCVVIHLIPQMKPYAGHATDKLILINMARHAHPGGCGITVGKYAQAEHLGCSDRRVWDAVKRLRRGGWIKRTAQRTAQRGGDTYRIELCQRCRRNTAADSCQQCSPPPAEPRARDAASGVAATPEQRELQGEPSATPVSSRSRPAAASPNGERCERALRPSRALPGSDASASEAARSRREVATTASIAGHPGTTAKQATAGAVLQFQAHSFDGGTRVGAPHARGADTHRALPSEIPLLALRHEAW